MMACQTDENKKRLGRRGASTSCLVRATLALGLALAAPPAVAGADPSDTVAQPEQGDPSEQVQRLCSGVTPEGEIIYFPCQEQPVLACSAVTPEGEIVYFVCNRQSASN